ncbi:lipoprotein [Brenneria goodwinii]|uniref:lipoprotein n=1 Tax=Brenneria goodwinii TaxID=1109412 RepID=UPI000EF22996|nr:lipoprotein [Brenneria goodwinii]MCG8155590.1 lipoprotein [Brenneria goodwinii]MCG8160383.1 lipoprotein [Brenneria goodwinii]MCG8164906.1 lipoprotein [Brenneria goodwinii]MCG8169437.1 lipoprotein [Brenneria goodwinii]MCG8174611.1 lipoprotein [Brenneria goodwinii]
MLKKLFFPLLAVLMLAGCASKSNTLNVMPKISLPSQDPTLMGVTISINGADQRSDQALAKVNRDGQLITLTPSRDLRFLLQEALEKQMAARGYMIGTGGPVALQIVVNHLYADVSEGNLRYNITTKADISILSQAANGNKQVKNYRSTYNVQGAFTATNDKITNAVNTVLGDVINDMAQDTSVSTFIKENAR